MEERYKKLTPVGDKPREMVTTDGYESLELYANAFMLDDDEVEALKRVIEEQERRKRERK
ncbi:hypothetical protein [Calidithermus roseus]|uniref:Uncharacterized protein n=1 Tax=Calidithermus roseus TaxID=1644118 RepID=A0A399EYR5_9DEIN|nr:hypothetical protein [Calidithermus roseus]RIH89158.1 hypothetical protein Mrose_00544 [Calidithermus roseus]